MQDIGAFMTYFPLSDTQRSWLDTAQAVASEALASRAAETDLAGSFPAEQLAACAMPA